MTSEPEPEGIVPRPTREAVFISAASQDHAVAERVCRLLELEGIGCWIAPRDVRPGHDYGEQIIGAIESAPVLVLILTSNANASVFVPKEVERAVSKGKPVFVLRVGQVLPSRALELFVSQSQWIDAWTPPLKARVQVLATAIRSLGNRPQPPRATPEPASRPSRPRGSALSVIPAGSAAPAVPATEAAPVPAPAVPDSTPVHAPAVPAPASPMAEPPPAQGHSLPPAPAYVPVPTYVPAPAYVPPPAYAPPPTAAPPWLTASPAPAPPPSIPARRNSTPMLAGLGIVALIAVIIVGAVVFTSGGGPHATPTPPVSASIDQLRPFIPSAIWATCEPSSSREADMVQMAVCSYAGVDSVGYAIFASDSDLQAAYAADVKAANAIPADSTYTCANSDVDGTWTSSTHTNGPGQGLLCYESTNSQGGALYTYIEQSYPALRVIFYAALAGDNREALLAWWKSNETIVVP